MDSLTTVPSPRAPVISRPGGRVYRRAMSTTPRSGSVGDEPYVHLVRRSEARSLGAAEMGLITGSREIARAVSDGTGLSPEEIGLLVVEAAVAGTVFGFLALSTSW